MYFGLDAGAVGQLAAEHVERHRPRREPPARRPGSVVSGREGGQLAGVLLLGVRPQDGGGSAGRRSRSSEGLADRSVEGLVLQDVAQGVAQVGVVAAGGLHQPLDVRHRVGVEGDRKVSRSTRTAWPASFSRAEGAEHGLAQPRPPGTWRLLRARVRSWRASPADSRATSCSSRSPARQQGHQPGVEGGGEEGAGPLDVSPDGCRVADRAEHDERVVGRQHRQHLAGVTARRVGPDRERRARDDLPQPDGAARGVRGRLDEPVADAQPRRGRRAGRPRGACAAVPVTLSSGRSRSAIRAARADPGSRSSSRAASSRTDLARSSRQRSRKASSSGPRPCGKRGDRSGACLGAVGLPGLLDQRSAGAGRCAGARRPRPGVRRRPRTRGRQPAPRGVAGRQPGAALARRGGDGAAYGGRARRAQLEQRRQQPGRTTRRCGARPSSQCRVSRSRAPAATGALGEQQLEDLHGGRGRHGAGLGRCRVVERLRTVRRPHPHGVRRRPAPPPRAAPPRGSRRHARPRRGRAAAGPGGGRCRPETRPAGRSHQASRPAHRATSRSSTAPSAAGTVRRRARRRRRPDAPGQREQRPQRRVVVDQLEPLTARLGDRRPVAGASPRPGRAPRAPGRSTAWPRVARPARLCRGDGHRRRQRRRRAGDDRLVDEQRAPRRRAGIAADRRRDARCPPAGASPSASGRRRSRARPAPHRWSRRAARCAADAAGRRRCGVRPGPGRSRYAVGGPDLGRGLGPAEVGPQVGHRVAVERVAASSRLAWRSTTAR